MRKAYIAGAIALGLAIILFFSNWLADTMHDNHAKHNKQNIEECLDKGGLVKLDSSDDLIECIYGNLDLGEYGD